MLQGLGWVPRAAALLLCCSTLLLGAAAQAQEDPPGRVGRITALQGEVWIYETEQGEWVSALHNRPFTAGDRLATTAGASAELRIGSTTLYLGSSSELAALRLDDQRMHFRLQRGSLALRVRSREVAAEVEVQHPEGRFMPLRAGLYRIDRQDEATDAAVWRGDLQVEGNGMSMTLYAGQRARFWLDGPLSDTRSQWLGPLQDDFAAAVQRQDQADVRSAAALFVPPEMTGVEDLDRHGRWQQHPEYGALWSPSVVVAGWAPYRHGQWVWLRPWGWTWVDDAPWGFAPFHYGRWLWWGNRWCWAPGPVLPRPVFAPALVGWAGGPQFQVGIGGRPVPAIGWVPLAPREHYRPGYRASPGHVNRLNPYAPHPQGQPPGYGNRAVPGAVTVLPSPTLAARQPVAAAALRADELALQRQWLAEPFHQQAPGRAPAPPRREFVAPRASMPLDTVKPMPAQSMPMPSPGPNPGPNPSPSTSLTPGLTPGLTPNPRPAPAAPSPAAATSPLPGAVIAPGRNAAVTPLPSAAVVPLLATAAPPLPAITVVPVPGPAAAPVPASITVPAPASGTAVLPTTVPTPGAAQGRPPGQPVSQAQERVVPPMPPMPPMSPVLLPAAAGPRPITAPAMAVTVPNPPAAAAVPPAVLPAPPASPQNRGAPQPHPFKPAAPVAVTAVPAPAATPTPALAKPATPVRVDPADAKPGIDPDERRRTPDSRLKQREK